jgi:predicted SAM-dependent methyltransferase
MGLDQLFRGAKQSIALKMPRFLGTIKRARVARQLEGHQRLHLGCGNNIIEGWANVDIQSNRKVIGWDLTECLPVRDQTIDLIFCEHFIEHVTLERAKTLLADCYRVLRAGGILRLSTPSLKKLVDEYLSGRTSEWWDVGWRPATSCQMLNEGLREWGHQFVYDACELGRLLEEAGFREVTQVAWRESTTPALRNLECRPFHGEIICEATKFSS